MISQTKTIQGNRNVYLTTVAKDILDKIHPFNEKMGFGNTDYIREQVGHTDERTTYGNYCFNRKSRNLTVQSLEKALVYN